MTVETWLGSGHIGLRPSGSAVPFERVGNSSELTFNIDEDEKSIPDYTRPGGGKYDSVRRITSVGLTMNLYDLTVGNLTRNLYASSRYLAPVAVTGETVTITPGRVTKLARMPLTINTVVGADGAFEVDRDWQISGGGIFIPEDAEIDADTEVTVDYAAAGVDVIEAMTTSGRTFEMLFEGMNEAGTQRRANIIIYRVKFGAASDLNFIGDDFASMSVTGEALKDSRTFGAGRSAFFRIEKERLIEGADVTAGAATTTGG
jgi:hypothetical protein